MLTIALMLAAAQAYPGDPPPRDAFAVRCTGVETLFVAKNMQTRPWSDHVRVDLPRQRYCLGDCASWRPIVRIEHSGVRLSEGPDDDAVLSWKAGRLHYLWANRKADQGPRVFDRQGDCVLEPD